MSAPSLRGEVDRPRDPDFTEIDIPQALKTPKAQAAVREAAQFFRAAKQIEAADPPGKPHLAAKRTLESIRNHARDLADLLSDNGPAESVWTALAVKGLDPHELTGWLHVVGNEADLAQVRMGRKGGKPPMAPERAFIWRLGLIYRKRGRYLGKINTPHRDPHSGYGSDPINTPFIRFVRAAFDYAGVSLPSVETIQRGASKPPYEKGD